MAEPIIRSFCMLHKISPQPKPGPKKRKGKTERSKRKASQDKERQSARSECREFVLNRERHVSRLTGRKPTPVNPLEVHELIRRSQGGSATGPENCVAILQDEHLFCTLNYITCEPFNDTLGANGGLRWILMERGEALLQTSGQIKSMDRKKLTLIWGRVIVEDK